MKMKAFLTVLFGQLWIALALSTAIWAHQGGRPGYFSTLQSVDTTNSTSSTTGATTIAGGLGVSKAANFGSTMGVAGILTSSNTTDASGITTGAIVTAGGVGISKKLYVGDNIALASTKRFYLDGGGDTYLVEGSANNIEVHAGSTPYLLGNAATELPPAYTVTTAAAANVVVVAGGGLARSTSSARYKSDIQPFAGGLSDLLALQPVSFVEKKNPHGPRYIGFTAEDVAQAGLPGLVVYDEQGRPDALQYDRLTTYLVNAVKELSAEVDALRALHDLPTTHQRPASFAATNRARASAEAQYRQCQVDNKAVIAAGGAPLACAQTTDAQAVEADDQSRQNAERQFALAECARLNTLITQQGGTPRTCGATPSGSRR